MKDYISYRHKPQLYAILPDVQETSSEDMKPSDPRAIAVLSPSLGQGSGVLPDSPEVSFNIQFASCTAKIRFLFQGRTILCAAVAWGAGQEAAVLWNWVCGSMSRSGCDLRRDLPETAVWAAIALPAAPLPTTKERILSAGGFVIILAPAIIGWRQAQN